MALGYATTDTQVVKLWSNRIYKDFITDSGLLSSMLEAGIISKQEQPQRGAGDTVTMSFLQRLTNPGLVGMQAADGQETSPLYFTEQMVIDQLRNPVSIPNVQTIAQQRVLYDLPEDSYKISMDWLSVRGTVSVFNQLAGFNPTFFTYDGTTYGTSNIPKTSLQGMNPVLPPSPTRIYYPNGYTTDDQVQADPTATMKLSYIDMLEGMAETIQPYIRPISERSGIKYHLYVHTWQYFQLIQDTTAPIQFRDLYGNLVMAGKTDGGIARSFVYGQTEVFRSDKLPCGVSSSTNLVLPNVRRAVFCGRDAGAIALGRGFNDGKEIVPGFIVRQDTQDIQQVRRIAISAIWGIKKLQFNGVDHGVIVLPTYVAQTNVNQ
jgi:hypothetical protein